MKISIVTVCFNSADHIADALRSVDRQTWPDIEHLVVDGASRDNTLGVVQAHPQPWRRVVSEPDKGIYDAMNKGIGLATGEVVGFINSDDFLAEPDTLSRIAATFEDPTVDATYGDLCYVNRDDPDTVVRYWRSSEFTPGSFAQGWVPPHPTFYVRRSVLQRLGGFDLDFRIAADWELMARLVEVNRIRTRYIPQVLVKMRMGGTTNKSFANVWAQNKEIWQAMKMHGLQTSLPSFAMGKLLSRGKQFLARPL